MRKKLVTEAKDAIENECSDDVEKLNNKLEISENKNKSCKNLILDLNLKLEKSKLELEEALAKNHDCFNKHTDLIEAHEKVKQDLSKTRAAHESLKLDIKEARKALKTKENEVARMASKIGDIEASLRNVKQERGEAFKKKNEAIQVIEQKDSNLNIQPYSSPQSCPTSAADIPLCAPPCTLPSNEQTRGSPSPPLSTFPPSTPTRSPPGSQPCMPTSPHTPPGLPPPSLASTSQPVQPAHSSSSISADYIMGINEIDLGPRVNDLSKM